LVRQSDREADLTSLPEEKKEKLTGESLPYVFGHTIEEQMGGQLAAGFVICDLYEDGWDDTETPLNKFTSLFMATLARKIRVE
jgi:hypothetical protein